MPRLHGSTSIEAPPERVWDAVLEDLAGMPAWAGYLRSASMVGGGQPGIGQRIRYQLDVPGEVALIMEPAVWDRPRRAAGRWVDGPITGTWSYDLALAGDATQLTYDMDIKLGGMLRFVSGMIQSRLDAGIADAMRDLKARLERPSTA